MSQDPFQQRKPPRQKLLPEITFTKKKQISGLLSVISLAKLRDMHDETQNTHAKYKPASKTTLFNLSD